MGPVCGFGIVPINNITVLCLSAVHVYVCSYPVPTAVSNKTCISYTVVYSHLQKLTLQGEVECSVVICRHLLLTMFWEKSFHVVFIIFMLGLSWTVFKIVVVLKQIGTAAQKCVWSLQVQIFVHPSTKHSSVWIKLNTFLSGFLDQGLCFQVTA